MVCGCQERRDIIHPEDISPETRQTLKSAPENYRPIKPKPLVKNPNQEPQPTSAMKKKVSLSLTEALPVKDAFLELARQADVDLQLDPRIDEKVTFSAKNRPFIEVIDHLCDLTKLRHRIIGGAIRIEKDLPYAKNYNIQFLNLARASQNRTSVATDVFSSNTTPQGTQKVTSDTGSNAAVNITSQNDFWQELSSNLDTILGEESHYAIHKQGGIISISATQTQHRQIQDYLTRLRQVVGTQVLIEAKVIEVALHDQFRSGINWQTLVGGDLFADIPLGRLAQQSGLMAAQGTQTDLLSFGFKGRNFAGILKCLEEFGASKTLSSPRLTVMNNQTAILKVAQNQVYFRLNYDRQYSLNVNRESFNVSSDIQTVPIGLVMSVQPSIDDHSGDVILSLRPTISRLTRSVPDPAVNIAYSANASANTTVQPPTSLIPVVEVREIDSVLRLKSGEIGVLGGLMEVRSTKEREQLPWLGDLKFFGEAFGANADGEQVVELVILLRATIIDENGPRPDATDIRLYEDHAQDPRPLEVHYES